MIITIDGPAASGKSSIADELAKHLGLPCLHTGLLYRAIAYISANSVPSLQNLEYAYRDGKPIILYNGTDITPHLSSTEIANATSALSAKPEIRELLYQHFFKPYGEHKNFVTEGRDCGTVLYPHADVKIFLTASIEKRAERMLDDKNRNTALREQAISNLQKRDERDSTRAVAPLKPSPDAVIIDSSALTFEQTVQACLDTIAASASSSS